MTRSTKRSDENSLRKGVIKYAVRFRCSQLVSFWLSIGLHRYLFYRVSIQFFQFRLVMSKARIYMHL